MISLYDGQIADLLPHNLIEEPAAQAYSLALRDVTRELLAYTELVHVYSKIEMMPSTILDMLARDLRTQYYTDELEIEVKRSLVRSTLIWYMTAGTPAAIEELVAAVFGEGEVVEWFEYDGEPYHFKIKTNAILDEDMMAYFSTMIQRVKNTRSHIESVEIRRSVKDVYYAGVGEVRQYKAPPITDKLQANGP